jgi:hypothetical protein
VVLAALPVPQAMKVLQVQSKSAKVQAPVKVGGAAATYRFQWTRTTVYGHKSTTVTVPAGQSAVTAAATLSGLLPHTAYRVRLMVTTLSGTVYSREIIVHTR